MSIFSNQKIILSGLTALSLVAGGAGQAFAASISIDATLTADNHYGLFTGNSNGSQLNFIGRNEKGPGGSSGGYNWSHAESWNFQADSKDHLYVVVWDDSAVDESWIGQFKLSTGKTLLSLADTWEYVISQGANPGDYGDVPTNQALFSEISSANWIQAQRRGDNGMSPWGFIQGVSADADFLNTTTPSNGKYTIFRTKLGVDTEYESTPEPGSMLGLLTLGLVGAGTALKRKASNDNA